MAGLGGMVPPVVFYVEAKADKAIASFKSINHELSMMEMKAAAAGKSVSRFNQVAMVGTQVLKGMAVAFVAAAAIGVKSIMDIEKSYSALGQAMANQGLATEANMTLLSQVADSYENLGFASENAADGLRVLITATGDLDKSQKLLKMSADLARAGHMSIEDAAKSLIRAQNGNIKIFTQFGIQIDKTKPKAEALAEAMGKLEQKLGGQAEAYAKTFAGQLAILKENLGDIFEAIGMKVLPVLNAFIDKINGAGKFVKDHQEFIVSLAAAITILLIPAMVNLAKSIVQTSKAILASPWGRIAAVVMAIAYAFVKSWNASETFRNNVIKIAKPVIEVFGYIVGAASQLVKTGLLAVKAFSYLFDLVGKVVPAFKGVGETVRKFTESIEKGWDDAAVKIGQFGKNLDKYKDSKIKFNIDLGMPKIQDFFKGQNGESTIDNLTNDVNQLADALINAKQRAIDFAQTMGDSIKDIADLTNQLIGRDTNAAIKEGLLDPVDQLGLKIGRTITQLNDAKGAYSGAMDKVTKAQKEYEAALKGTDKALIASAESALKRAEQMATDVLANQKKALEDLIALQDQAIGMIVDNYQQIAELQKERAKVIADGQKEEAQATKEYLAEKLQLEKDYAKQVQDAQIAAQKRAAEIVKQSVDQLRNVYRSATQQSIGDIFSNLTFQGKYLKGGTVGAMINSLGLQLNKAKSLADDAAALSGLGFTQTFIEQVVAQGPDVGHALAQQIIKATPESIKQLQDYWTASDRQSQHGVDLVAKNLNSGLTLATEELTAQLAQVGIDLQNELAGYATTFNEAMGKLTTKYNETIAQIKINTDTAVAAIDASIANLTAKITQLQALLAQIALLQAQLATAQTTPYPTSVTGTVIPIPNYSGPPAGSVIGGGGVVNAFYQPKNGTGTITINQANYTNASAQSIADATAWAIRSSSDVEYGYINTDAWASTSIAPSSVEGRVF